ncbi:hypothetical protein [Spirosoma montaniterrae]|uniref:Uncharacterized protein n=1 Tax=Spirosoma montaniterrae TaxID=1178516 RepID=A0A1P9WXR6_9BACT|nr:hypothetical protein [Spirosoma montaniterrae]AQG80150.1 hypothetical protein AWR27_12955 [Spirosoma montaniterrae]
MKNQRTTSSELPALGQNELQQTSGGSLVGRIRPLPFPVFPKPLPMPLPFPIGGPIVNLPIELYPPVA